ncbi:MAG: DUF3619 family protein [Pseudomonadota bacterium]
MTNSTMNRTEILQDRQGLKVASYLSVAASALPHDVTERLRVARMQALAQRKLAAAAALTTVSNGSSASLLWGEDGPGWLGRLGAIVPLIALVFGLLFINSVQNDNRARELAEIDVALLTDDLPPAAFADPGFIQFLKTNP